ncbi:hypothetical protein GCM10018987_62280 [Streptomyces cremeus]
MGGPPQKRRGALNEAALVWSSVWSAGWQRYLRLAQNRVDNRAHTSRSNG